MTPAGPLRYKIQLQDKGLGGIMAGPSITGAGGQVTVLQAGSPRKQAVTDYSGNVIANPIPLTNGSASWAVPTSVASVDLLVNAPDGQQLQIYGVKPDAMYDLPIDRTERRQLICVPFSIASGDSVAATEKDTGIILPNKCLVQVDVVVDVTTLESGKTLNVGTLSSQSGGSATGFATGVSLTTATSIALQSKSTKTRGGLFVDGAAGSPDLGYDVDLNAARNISYTLSSGSTVGEGFVWIPIMLFGRGFPTLS